MLMMMRMMMTMHLQMQWVLGSQIILTGTQFLAQTKQNLILQAR